jgi:hypothetical protein
MDLQGRTKDQRIQLAKDHFIKQNLELNYSDAYNLTEIVTVLSNTYDLTESTIMQNINLQDWIGLRASYKANRDKEFREQVARAERSREVEMSALRAKLLNALDRGFDAVMDRIVDDIPIMETQHVLKAADTLLKMATMYNELSKETVKTDDNENATATLETTLQRVEKLAGEPSKVIDLAERALDKGTEKALAEHNSQAAEKEQLFNRLSEI